MHVMSQDPHTTPGSNDAEHPAMSGEPESGQPTEDQGVIDRPREIGGPKGPEPTRFGDWEKGGRCIDF